jgi:hypothetical protein
VLQPEKTQLQGGFPAGLPRESEANPVLAIVRRVNAGDRDALVKLRSFLRASRAAAPSLGGDLSFEANACLVKDFMSENPVAREALNQELINLRLELCGKDPYPTGIERLLIEDVVATWLHLHRLQYMYARQEQSTFRTDSYYQKELTAAHGRYLAAIKTLIDARRRPLPNIQINVANEQVNVAVNVTAAPPPPKDTPAPLG